MPKNIPLYTAKVYSSRAILYIKAPKTRFILYLRHIFHYILERSSFSDIRMRQKYSFRTQNYARIDAFLVQVWEK